MSIISKETWDKFTQEEKEEIREWCRDLTKNSGYDPEDFNNGFMHGRLEMLDDLFGKEALQPQPLTYEDVEKKLKETEGGIEWVGTYFADKVNAIVMLLEVAKFLNKDWKPDWENVQEPKWYIEDLENEIGIDCIVNCNSRLVYFRTKELAEQAIQILGEEVIRLALTTEY